MLTYTHMCFFFFDGFYLPTMAISCFKLWFPGSPTSAYGQSHYLGVCSDDHLVEASLQREIVPAAVAAAKVCNLSLVDTQ